MNSLEEFLQFAETIPGWTRAEEAEALTRHTYDLPDHAVIVEIGSFLGSGTVMLAGARKLRGTGKVYCVDPFDASGDSFSVPHYQAIIAGFQATQRDLFNKHIEDAALADWVEVRQGKAEQVASNWTTPIDLLFLDGDQSPSGAKAAYDSWSPWLKSGGLIALHNSSPRQYDVDHDGHYLLAVNEIQPPAYRERRVVGSITFGRKT